MISEGYFGPEGEPGHYERRWIVADAKAHVIIIHGFREHCARYDHIAEALNQRHLSVYSFDQRGHGKSLGKKGVVMRFDDFLDDLDKYLKHVQRDFLGQPVGVLAHSMGALVFTRYLQTRNWRPSAAVISSPFFEIPPVSPLLLSLADFLSKATPWLPVAKLESEAISRIPEVVRQYDADPLNGHGPIPARTGAELTNAVRRAREQMDRVDIPLYVMHGTADRLAPFSGGQYYFQHAASADKTWREYDGGYHELMNDLVQEQAKQEVADWLQKHLCG